MFPAPIRKASVPWQLAYRTLLPVSLFLWLLPLMAVAVFSIKPADDFTTGNYWGPPSTFEAAANYGRVFFESDMPRYLLNSLLITVPTVIGAVALSCMTGFALGVYRFRANLWLFFMFVAGNFVPFRFSWFPSAISPWSSALQHEDRTRAVPHRVPDGVLHPLHAQLHPHPPVRAHRVRARRRRQRVPDLPLRGAAAHEARHRGALDPHLHLHLERLLLGGGVDPGRREPAGNRRHHELQRAVPGRLPSDERRLHRCRPPPRWPCSS